MVGGHYPLRNHQRGTLIDVPPFASMDDVRFLHHEAEECRRMARDPATGPVRYRQLLQLAEHYDKEARRLNLEQAKVRAY